MASAVSAQQVAITQGEAAPLVGISLASLVM